MNSRRPEISVIMPVFNGDKYLLKSIRSILNQTFKNFELIIVNDGSTDGSLKILESFNDDRIVIVNNQKNMGISHALNKGLKLAKGNYIARQDADDESYPDRFLIQKEYLESNNIDLVDTNLIFTDENDQYLQEYEERYFSPDETLSHLFFYEINHATIMCKRSLLIENDICYLKRKAEDYDLFIRLAKSGMRAGRIYKNLYKYRKHSKSACGSNWEDIKEDIDSMRIELVLDLDIKPTEYEKKLHIAFIEQNSSVFSNYNFEEILFWSNRIIEANRLKSIYSQEYFKEQIFMRIIRYAKMQKRKSFLDMLKLKNSAKLYDKSISLKTLFYLYRFSS